jgi:hypothetical protein
LQSGTALKHHQSYSIITGTRIRSDAGCWQTEVVVAGVLNLSMANVLLLEHIASRHKTSLDRRPFVQLETRKNSVNPKFIDSHSVRHGELGWGLDAEGCLSLYATGIVDEKLKERVWYVKKAGIKVVDTS